MDTRWVDWIEKALTNLRGEACLENVYAEILKIRPGEFSKEWKATVRNVLESHSSDSLNWDSKRPDLFYSVAGKGSGIWGLRAAVETKRLSNDSRGGNGFAPSEGRVCNEVQREAIKITINGVRDALIAKGTRKKDIKPKEVRRLAKKVLAGSQRDEILDLARERVDRFKIDLDELMKLL